MPQDPNGEPASMLVERIKTELAKIEANKKKGRKIKRIYGK